MTSLTLFGCKKNVSYETNENRGHYGKVALEWLEDLPNGAYDAVSVIKYISALSGKTFLENRAQVFLSGVNLLRIPKVANDFYDAAHPLSQINWKRMDLWRKGNDLVATVISTYLDYFNGTPFLQNISAREDFWYSISDFLEVYSRYSSEKQFLQITTDKNLSNAVSEDVRAHQLGLARTVTSVVANFFSMIATCFNRSWMSLTMIRGLFLASTLLSVATHFYKNCFFNYSLKIA